MLEKVKDKIQRRFEVLPKHHIDTDVLIESFKGTKLGDQCTSYLNRVGYNYRGVLSVSVLGEYSMITYEKMKEKTDLEIAFEFVRNLILRRKISFCGVSFECYNIVEKIKEIDNFIEPADALHLAAAIADNASTFVTFDSALLNSQKLESSFGIKIMHPKDL